MPITPIRTQNAQDIVDLIQRAENTGKLLQVKDDIVQFANRKTQIIHKLDRFFRSSRYDLDIRRSHVDVVNLLINKIEEENSLGDIRPTENTKKLKEIKDRVLRVVKTNEVDRSGWRLSAQKLRDLIQKVIPAVHDEFKIAQLERAQLAEREELHAYNALLSQKPAEGTVWQQLLNQHPDNRPEQKIAHLLSVLEKGQKLLDGPSNSAARLKNAQHITLIKQFQANTSFHQSVRTLQDAYAQSLTQASELQNQIEKLESEVPAKFQLSSSPKDFEKKLEEKQAEWLQLSKQLAQAQGTGKPQQELQKQIHLLLQDIEQRTKTLPQIHQLSQLHEQYKLTQSKTTQISSELDNKTKEAIHIFHKLLPEASGLDTLPEQNPYLPLALTENISYGLAKDLYEDRLAYLSNPDNLAPEVFRENLTSLGRVSIQSAYHPDELQLVEEEVPASFDSGRDINPSFGLAKPFIIDLERDSMTFQFKEGGVLTSQSSSFDKSIEELTKFAGSKDKALLLSRILHQGLLSCTERITNGRMPRPDGIPSILAGESLGAEFILDRNQHGEILLTVINHKKPQHIAFDFKATPLKMKENSQAAYQAGFTVALDENALELGEVKVARSLSGFISLNCEIDWSETKLSAPSR